MRKRKAWIPSVRDSATIINPSIKRRDYDAEPYQNLEEPFNPFQPRAEAALHYGVTKCIKDIRGIEYHLAFSFHIWKLFSKVFLYLRDSTVYSVYLLPWNLAFFAWKTVDNSLTNTTRSSLVPQNIRLLDTTTTLQILDRDLLCRTNQYSSSWVLQFRSERVHWVWWRRTIYASTFLFRQLCRARRGASSMPQFSLNCRSNAAGRLIGLARYRRSGSFSTMAAHTARSQSVSSLTIASDNSRSNVFRELAVRPKSQRSTAGHQIQRFREMRIWTGELQGEELCHFVISFEIMNFYSWNKKR